MGLLNRSDTLQTKSKGLLKKMLRSPLKDSILKKTEHIENISGNTRNSINNLKDGIDSSFYLLNILSNNINFDKGCILFLLEQNQLFVPGARININNQTLKSLKQSHTKYLNLLDNRKSVFISDKKGLNKVKLFFSRSDFNKINNLLLYPFFAENKFVALILLCNINYEYSGFLNTLFINYTEEIINNRYSILNKFDKNLILSENELNLIISKNASLKPNITSLSFENIMKDISARNKLITSNIIKQDFYLLFSNFFKKSAGTFASQDRYLNILFNNFDEINCKLISHQANIFLRNYYKEISGSIYLEINKKNP